MPNEITIWIRVAGHFINQNNIRAIMRLGKGTRISLIKGKDIVVPVSYEKIRKLIPKL
jgi:hypothetical protein